MPDTQKLSRNYAVEAGELLAKRLNCVGAPPPSRIPSDPGITAYTYSKTIRDGDKETVADLAAQIASGLEADFPGGVQFHIMNMIGFDQYASPGWVGTTCRAYVRDKVRTATIVRNLPEGAGHQVTLIVLASPCPQLSCSPKPELSGTAS
jgi:hypothetical protein